MTTDTITKGSYSSVFEAELPTIAYDHLTNPFEAHRAIAAAREQAPIAMGRHAPEVLSYELVRTVLRDNRFVTAPGLGPDLQGVISGPLWERAAANILSLDGEQHHRLCRLLSKPLAPGGVKRMRALAVKIITELVDPLTRVGRCDVVSDIAWRYPTPIICALLGAPREDRPLFSGWVDDIKNMFDWNVAEDGPAISAAWDQLDVYLEQMIAGRREHLTDDVISDLIRTQDDSDRLNHDELLMLAATLLGAGADITRNQLAAAIQVLADHPEQWKLLAQHPELAANALHESMRYCPIVFAVARTAAEDVELGGVTIPAGTLVLANTASANRDTAVYERSECLDITRDDPPAMLTFDGGTHYSLGAHLARIELTEALRAITQRMPNPRRTQPATWKPMTGVTGPISVSLEFDTGH